MLEMLKDHLNKQGVFNGRVSEDMLSLSNCVTGDVSTQMKHSIAISEIMLYASQFRRYIKLPADKHLIPINSISFVLAASGANKDRTVKAIRSALEPGYIKIDAFRKDLAKTKAIQMATADGREAPDKWDSYKDFYRQPGTLFAAMTNSAAYLDHLADIERLAVGAGFMYTGELGSEMETNADMIPSIRVMSEIYDVGYKEAKPLKNKEAQTPEIKNLAVSALFIGSHDNILFDEKIKNIFKKEFTTKLARRSFFSFSPEDVISPSYTSVAEMIRIETSLEEEAIAARDRMSSKAEEIAEYNLSSNPEPLQLSKDTKELYDVYLRYNTEVSKLILDRFPITKLVRKHMQWKALKLAGAFAIFDCAHSITMEHLIRAISYVESIESDMSKFETELVKEKYEVFCDYMKSRSVHGKASITLHALKKLEYITGAGAPQTKMKELISLSSSLDPDGIYTIKDNKIFYETIIKTDVTGASFLYDDYSELHTAYENKESEERIKHIKFKMAARSVGNYVFKDVEFNSLGGLLVNDVAFTPFRLKTPADGAAYNKEKSPHIDQHLGVRGRENIISGTKWICFDIDKSYMTLEETSFTLQDINHHIALTSDKNNLFKFRIIVELDAIVEVDPSTWVYFAKSIADYLSIDLDKLPQSQIFFGYKDRPIISITDKKPIEIKDHIAYALSEAQEQTPVKEYTKSEKEKLIKNPFSTFEYAFNSENGAGSRNLYSAARKAHALGMEVEDVVSLVQEISDYWDYPMEDYRLQALFRQIRHF